jgi:hypothetical protein
LCLRNSKLRNYYKIIIQSFFNYQPWIRIHRVIYEILTVITLLRGINRKVIITFYVYILYLRHPNVRNDQKIIIQSFVTHDPDLEFRNPFSELLTIITKVIFKFTFVLRQPNLRSDRKFIIQGFVSTNSIKKTMHKVLTMITLVQKSSELFKLSFILKTLQPKEWS